MMWCTWWWRKYLVHWWVQEYTIQYYTILTRAILTLTKAKSAAAMTQMEQERKRAVAVRGEARTAFVKILKGGRNIF